MVPWLLLQIPVGIAAKLGISQLAKKGLMPRSTYLSQALKALDHDDLDQAIHCYQLATKYRQPNTQTEIVGETILAAIDIRIMKLETEQQKLEIELYPRKWSLNFLKNKLKYTFNLDYRKFVNEQKQEYLSYKEGINVLQQLSAKLKKGSNPENESS